MNEPKIEVTPDGKISVIGELNHQTVPALLKKSASVIFSGNSQQSGELVIDLNAVSRSDSAGVALLIEWIRQAKHLHKSIRFNNIPHQMHEIAEVTGVDEMLAK
jgi:phospholipid transport system transporter-binding protein